MAKFLPITGLEPRACEVYPPKGGGGGGGGARGAGVPKFSAYQRLFHGA